MPGNAGNACHWRTPHLYWSSRLYSEGSVKLLGEDFSMLGNHAIACCDTSGLSERLAV
jgi:hypothetical protein